MSLSLRGEAGGPIKRRLEGGYPRTPLYSIHSFLKNVLGVVILACSDKNCGFTNRLPDMF